MNTGWNILAFSCLKINAGSIHVVSSATTSEFIYDISGSDIGRSILTKQGKSRLSDSEYDCTTLIYLHTMVVLDKQGILGTEDFVLVKLETLLMLCLLTMSDGYLLSTKMSLIL